MFYKFIFILIVMSAACIVAFSLNILDSAEVDVEKATDVAEISTKPSIVALATVMKNFRDSLNEELLADASFPLGHKEMYSWSNLPPSRNQDRGGIGFGRLSEEQLSLFCLVLNAFMSDEGYKKVSLITTRSETDIREVKHSFWTSRPYYIVLFGNPGTDGSWGFQLDGHHLSLNFLVHGDDVSIVPSHIGTQPTTINGNIVLEGERHHVLNLFNSLDTSQKKQALQTGRRGLKVGPGSTTDPHLNYNYSEFVGIGLKASKMNDVQKENLRKLIKSYVYNLDSEFADTWMRDIDKELDETYFVLIGGTTENDSIYYRVFNPVVWIEFNDEDRSGDRPNHIHTILRAPNGNDYGIFAMNRIPKTLLEHYMLTEHYNKNYYTFDYYIPDLSGTEIAKEH